MKIEKTQEQILLEQLRSELQALKDEEIKKKVAWKESKESGPAYNLHFDDINPFELLEEDLRIFGKFKDKSLTLEEFQQYRESIIEYSKKYHKMEDVLRDSRCNFQAWLGNQVSTKEWLEKWYPDTFGRFYRKLESKD
jgi:hypothetical protein